MALRGRDSRRKAQSGASRPLTPAPKKAEEQFKNIQVLKGIPADQADSRNAVHSCLAGRGVRVLPRAGGVRKRRQEAEADSTEDDGDDVRHQSRELRWTSRSNLLFMPPWQRRSGGDATGDGGRSEAGRSRSKEERRKKREGAETKESSGPTADQLLDKYLQAAGGATAIEKVSSRVMKGTITFGDRNVPIDIFSKDPDKRVSFTHTPDGDSVTAFDGHEGWLGIPGHPVREMHGPDIDGAAMDADLQFAAHLRACSAKRKCEARKQSATTMLTSLSASAKKRRH